MATLEELDITWNNQSQDEHNLVAHNLEQQGLPNEIATLISNSSPSQMWEQHSKQLTELGYTQERLSSLITSANVYATKENSKKNRLKGRTVEIKNDWNNNNPENPEGKFGGRRRNKKSKRRKSKRRRNKSRRKK